MSLKYDNFRFYWAVIILIKRLKNAKVSYLCAGILSDKSAFSPVIDISLKSKTNTNE